jgi:hypothetical protein
MSMINPAAVDISTLPHVPLKLAQSLPKIPALYFCMSGEELLYIGMTQNLFHRWKAHHKVIHWLAIAPEHLSPELERDFIDHWQPLLNGHSQFSASKIPEAFLNAIARREDGYSSVFIPPSAKKRLAEQLNITTNDFDQYIQTLVTLAALTPIDKHEYRNNPSYFSQGKYIKRPKTKPNTLSR